MRPKSSSAKKPAEQVVKDIRRATRRHFPAERDVADRFYLLQNHRLGCMYLSTVLDDFSRYIIAWKLCSTMRAEDVTDTLEPALKVTCSH